MVDPLRRLANTVGRDSKLSTRGTLVDGELRSAQGPGSAPPVWFVFTGEHAASAHICEWYCSQQANIVSHPIMTSCYCLALTCIVVCCRQHRTMRWQAVQRKLTPDAAQAVTIPEDKV